MELDFIDWLRRRLPPHPRLTLGIGDDAAIVRLASPDCVLTTDMLMDGVDFDLATCDPRRAGRKALAVNLSDLAAMAATPEAALVSLALPKDGGLELAIALYEGLLPLADEFDLAIAGGDTNSWSGPLAISITAVGSAAAGGWRRSGARPGDQIVVTGEFGGSILGRHFDFTPRVREALYLRQRYEIHAAIDVSDGLSLDLLRLCEASGVGAVVDLDCVPVSAAAKMQSENEPGGPSPLDRALADGEDFELILAAPPHVVELLVNDSSPGIAMTRIGEIVAEPGLWRKTGVGKAPLEARGYLH